MSIFQNYRRKWSIKNVQQHNEMPDYFLIEVFNPAKTAVDVTVEIRPKGTMSRLPFLKRFLVTDFQRFKIPVAEIAEFVDLSQPYDISVIPNTEFGNVTLCFGALDFVRDRNYTKFQKTQQKSRKIKTLVWDLDNTLWEGTLIEDGLKNLRLKSGVKEILSELDQRGILLSIASKNNYNEAIAALEHFGLSDLFLYPQITWGPKGQAVKRIADRFNIGIDTVAFIDDSPFERAEVAAVCPEVLRLDANDYKNIIYLQEFDAIKTKESAQRRKYYQGQVIREEFQSKFDGQYFDFLQSCEIEFLVKKFSEDNIERVYELTQRTNQMNFSGNRYTKCQLKEMLISSNLLCLVLNCSDKFSTYGTIGFSVIRKQEPRMIDLMFSCRVQSKRVEHAFLTYVLNQFKEMGESKFFVDYRKTERNEPSGRVFQDFGFDNIRKRNGILELEFSLNKTIPNDRIITVEGYNFCHESTIQING